MARPLTITVGTGAPDTSVPTGPEINGKWIITGPDGTRAVFNDPTDLDYVGMLTDVSGFDAPELRESADDLVQMDGGIHGDFYYSRRPVTLTGLVLNPASADERNRKMTKIMRACRALRSDAIVEWTLSGGYQQYISARLQNGPRFEGAWQKSFQIGFVAADPRIYSKIYQQNAAPAASPYAALTLNNAGNADTWPLVSVRGPGTNPTVVNYSTGQAIRLVYTIPTASDFVVFDAFNRTVKLNNTASVYSGIDFINSDWWALAPGDNEIRLYFDSFSTGASLTVEHRSAWL